MLLEQGAFGKDGSMTPDDILRGPTRPATQPGLLGNAGWPLLSFLHPRRCGFKPSFYIVLPLDYVYHSTQFMIASILRVVSVAP